MTAELKKFYEKEYDTLSNAHFQAAQRITTFFQYALIILSAPITIIGLNKGTSQIIDQLSINLICIAISLVGFFIVMYLGQLRTEVLMYARCINTIRKLFYDKNRTELILHNEYSVLFTQKRKPKYWDGEQFIFIILSLGIINTSYLIYAVHNIFCSSYWVYIICPIFFIFHFVFYYIFTRQSEANTRFYKHTIGIDIDGVLNLHKEQFVLIYNILVDEGKIKETKISIDDIKTIPVQDAGKIKESDARKVFNTSDYWDTMPAISLAGKVISEKLHNIMGYKICIFTNRDWNPLDSQKRPYNIKKNTKKWLKENGIPAKNVYFESGNFDSPISVNTALYKNRFYISAARKIEFFVEDKPLNARRLANICRYVFLINDTYNQENKDNPFPYNVIRVTGWEDIYKHIEEL